MRSDELVFDYDFLGIHDEEDGRKLTTEEEFLITMYETRQPVKILTNGGWRRAQIMQIVRARDNTISVNVRCPDLEASEGFTCAIGANDFLLWQRFSQYGAFQKISAKVFMLFTWARRKLITWNTK